MTTLQHYLASSVPYLTDGGLETDLIFHDGLDLPLFASFVLLDDDTGRQALTRYFNRFLDLAEGAGRGFVLDTVTWRANGGWGPKLGLSAADLRRVNRDAVEFAKALQARRAWSGRMVIEGCIGPAGDGYAPDQQLTPAQAMDLHRPQMETFAETGVDLAAALTMTHVGEAIGLARLGQELELPMSLSFTVETDGRLPVGGTLADAIAAVDDATGGAPLYYGINCAHPTHFMDLLHGDWLKRIGVIRANASICSHAELDAATELDDGDPEDFGALYARLAQRLPALHLLGGCCGTDVRHVAAILAAA